MGNSFRTEKVYPIVFDKISLEEEEQVLYMFRKFDDNHVTLYLANIIIMKIV